MANITITDSKNPTCIVQDGQVVWSNAVCEKLPENIRKSISSAAKHDNLQSSEAFAVSHIEYNAKPAYLLQHTGVIVNEKLKELEYAARRDSLTGLHNKLSFSEQLEKEFTNLDTAQLLILIVFLTRQISKSYYSNIKRC